MCGISLDQQYPTGKKRGVDETKGNDGKSFNSYNLEFDDFSVQLNGANFEVDTNCADVAFSVCVISETKQKARLSDTGITNQKELKKIVAGRENKKSKK